MERTRSMRNARVSVRWGSPIGLFLVTLLMLARGWAQLSMSGALQLSGAGDVGVAAQSGSPLTYNARTDNCVHGYSTNPASQYPFYDPTQETCTPGTTTGENGSALIFQDGTSDPVPFNRLDDSLGTTGRAPALMNTSFTDPDFGSYSVFATDEAVVSSNPAMTWSMGSAGGYDAFNQDGSLLIFQNSGSVIYMAHINKARFLAHTCSTSNSCITISNVHGGSTPDSSHFDNGSGLAFSRNPADGSNTLYEGSPTLISKLTVTTTAGVDSITRTSYVDFTSDTGGPNGNTQCSVLAPGYNPTWQGGFTVSNTGGITIASAGGSPWPGVIGVAPGTPSVAVTADDFIIPVNNATGITNFMFQATTAGTTGTNEPNWSASCPAVGTSCTDGTAVWTNIGKVAGQGPGFDVVNYRPGVGCSRINARLSKIYRGHGDSEPAGKFTNDDKMICDRVTNTNCTKGTVVSLFEPFTLHSAAQQDDSNYAIIGVTGGGSITGPAGNLDYNTGSCYQPGVTYYGAWNSSTNYPAHTLVFYTDGVYYYTTTGAPGVNNPPIVGGVIQTPWKYGSSSCYNYTLDWRGTIMHPCLEVGPVNGYSGQTNSTCDGHQAEGYSVFYKGGSYFRHYLSKPMCDDNTAPCNYMGQANDGLALLPNSLPNDGHPTHRNVGMGDLQPIFDPTADVPAWGSPNLPTGPTGSRYRAAGYTEEVAFTTDGSQKMWRFGHSYNSGSNAGFGAQNAIGVISQQGDILAFTTDAMNTRGDNNTGAATCARPLRGQYMPGPGQTSTYQDYVLPVTSNSPQNIYQVTTCGANTTGATCTEATNPNWNTACPDPINLGTGTCDTGKSCTCSDSGGVGYTNVGPNTCRADIVLMDVASAHPAP